LNQSPEAPGEESGDLQTMVAPKVTVIIPSYNRVHYLGDAIGSVLAQTFDDFEIIVVDDGSTDASADLLRAIDDPRLRYLYQPHRGISAALNNGIRHARGVYVTRLDSDDLWLPGLLQTLVPLLEAQPQVGVAYASGQAIDSQGNRLAHVQGIPERFPGDALRSLLYEDCTCNIALVARRECFDRAGSYDETLLANEDWDMWLRVARHYRFIFVDEVLALIRWHAENLTGVASPSFAAVLDARTVPLDRQFADPDLPPAARAMMPAAYSNVHLYRGLRWLRVGHFRRAGRELGAALARSDQRLATTIRIAWFAAIAPLLSRTTVGRQAIAALATLRRRRRARQLS
jgi:glycosyltransferase involved in cell wall biosynthesis